MIEAYDLRTLEQLAQFRTVSPVAQVANNSRGGSTRCRKASYESTSSGGASRPTSQ